MMNILGTVLCLILQGPAAAVSTDPNLIDQAHLMRQILLQDQIQTLTADANEPGDELPVLDALIEELSSLEIAEEPKSVQSEQSGREDIESRKVEPEVEVLYSKPVLEETIEEPLDESVPESEIYETNFETKPAAESKPSQQVVKAEETTGKLNTEEVKIVHNDIPLDIMDSVSYISNPLQIADALYLSGAHQKASRFYQQYTETNEDPSSPEYQWALYQYAVCMAEDNPQKANRAFQKLIASSPNSPWTAAGQARMVTLTWAQDNTIRELKGMTIDPNSL